MNVARDHADASFKVVRSPRAFDDTVVAIETELRAAGNTIFATIDQAKAAEGAGMRLRPTTLIVFGKPQAGTPLMEATPTLALDFPLKIVVWEDQTGVAVAFNTMAVLAGRFGDVSGASLSEMDERVQALVAKALVATGAA